MRSLTRHITSKLPRNLSRVVVNPHTTRKMSLFGPRFYTPDSEYAPNFSGLFRLIDDFDRYASQGGELQPTVAGRRTQALVTPRFDLHEDDAAYHLEGELPGVPKENVQIEFADDQTISIRGRVERSYESGAPEGARVTEAGETPPEQGKKEVAKREDKDKQVATSSARPRYWVSERSIGEFSRSFNFPSRVDPEGVKASMNNGILEVLVPKAKKAESKRVVTIS
ncbi:HSP20-like chaperone [Xylariaceae sp. FL0662B]|nr:HSP20-like chaperone [Xylariaceae sp. FL0662B]